MNNANLVVFGDDEVIDDLIQSSSSSEDEMETELLKTAIFLIPAIKLPRSSIKNYCEEVVTTYGDDTFKNHFRVTRQLAQNIIEKFSNSHEFQTLLTARSRISISAEKHVLTFIWFAGHQTASYRDVADRWDLSLSSLYDVITRVSKFLCTLKSEVIKMPDNLEKQRTKKFFHEKYGLSNIMGALDGCHIKIDKPTDRHTDYFNRKHFYSMILQGVCNEEKKFIDVFIGYPGSVHDARVFRNSELYNRHIRKLSLGVLEDYILADSAYPLLPTVITPYRDNGHLNRTQKKFNGTLSSCRVFIEHTFGLLKQRFRQLYHIKLRDISRTCQFIMACCVLHNLAIGDGIEFACDNYDKMVEQPQTEPLPDVDARTPDGIYHRDKLARTLMVELK